ncbi:hypothetical protein RV08_GL000895 [Enterococcus mundtii]|nr:hypothetical protein RV08_GL000895 [Enterococcus mundtii]
MDFTIGVDEDCKSFVKQGLFSLIIQHLGIPTFFFEINKTFKKSS